MRLGFSWIFMALFTGAPAALAATVEADVQALAGEWQGEDESGHGARLAVAALAEPGTLATLTVKVDDGVFARDTAHTLAARDGLHFLVPGQGATADYAGTYTLLRLPGGGLRFVRLARVVSEDMVAVQTEEVVVGRARADGSRTLKLARGERSCWEGGADAPVPCGPAVSTIYLIRKANP